MRPPDLPPAVARLGSKAAVARALGQRDGRRLQFRRRCQRRTARAVDALYRRVMEKTA